MSLFYISKKQFESSEEMNKQLNKSQNNETSIIERNINMVMMEASATKKTAFKAIRKNNWSVKLAILELCSFRYSEKKMEEDSCPMPMEEKLLCTESGISRDEVFDEENVFIIDL